MSLFYEAQFVPSNLLFSANVGVDSVGNIMIFYLVFSAAFGV